MKHWLTILLTILTTALPAQQRFEATVVDAQTREALPFASVYVSPKVSTISNTEGAFTLSCDSADVLRISFVGYKPLQIQAARLGRQIALQPLDHQLPEVTVTSFELKDFIRKTTKEARRQRRKYETRQARFFYRQTSFADSACFELMEAFLQAGSAVHLSHPFLLKGRFAGIQPDSLHRYSFYTNFFTISELPMLTQNDARGNNDPKPLTRNYRDFYDVDYSLMGSGDGQLVALRFTPKPDITRPILDVTLYVDRQSHRLRKMEGSIRNVGIVHRDYKSQQVDTTTVLKTIVTRDTATFNLTVNMTEERGFVEVQSVYVDEQYERYGKKISTRSILFNVGSEETVKGMRMGYTGDLHKYIRRQGYDPEFWSRNEIVRRTPVEQEVMELFEQQNLFGVFR